MRIKLVLGVRIDGEHHDAGEELDADVPTARLFIGANQAVAIDPLPAAPPLTARGEIEHRDPRPRT